MLITYVHMGSAATEAINGIYNSNNNDNNHTNNLFTLICTFVVILLILNMSIHVLALPV